MKSSFSWPGRPPAEMISRNVKRLLTSILDGRLKRGAFCTSTLDGRLKRDAFLCTRVGAYCIRPTKRSHKGMGSAKGDQTCDFLSPTGPFGRAYAIRPYHATSKRDAFYTSYLVATLKRGAFCTSYLVATLKRGAFCTSYLVATPKRGAFYTSYLVATLKRGAFLCTRVGAYCIRPTKRSRKGTGSAKGDQTCDFLSPTGPFGGAYLSTPYHATSKRDAFCLFHLSRNTETRCVFMYPGRGVLHTPHQTFPQGDGICKRRPNARLFVPYGAIRWGVCNTPLPATSKRDAFASSFSIVVFSSFIFLCLSSLFSSGRSSFRCSVMCAP